MSDEVTRLIDALQAAVVVGPQDKLVLVFKDLTRKTFDEIVAQFDEKHDLKGRVLLVGNADELAVLRGES